MGARHNDIDRSNFIDNFLLVDVDSSECTKNRNDFGEANSRAIAGTRKAKVCSRAKAIESGSFKTIQLEE